ncbi:MAG: VWA domain-containing protein [Planctomycetaceae bacterium]|jgi:Ca-activated chloride channel family protein|nr:VWA domain-containing protein [Planctomycetaceae bacterium]
MFDQPYYLLFLWLIPVFAFLIRYAYQRKRCAAEQFLQAAMRKRLMPGIDGVRILSRSIVLLTALSFSFVAAANPMFGVYFEEVSRKGADIFVLLDVSRSMLAEDTAPNRLMRAKSDIKDLLQRIVGDRVGLIVFAGKPIVKVPLTTDHGFYNEILDSVDTNSAPRGGTAIGDAIRKALDVMPPESDRDQAIVLITDGDDQESMPLEAAGDAAARKVRILTVGLGDAAEGGRIPIRDADGKLTYLKHEGREVWSKVNEQTLKEIALQTGGIFIPAETRAFDLGQFYIDYLGRLKGGEYQIEQRKKFRQQYQVFLVIAVLLLLVYIAVPEYRTTENKTSILIPAHNGNNKNNL